MIYDEPGRGRKKCNCGKYTGVFSHKCENCGHEFAATSPVKRTPPPKRDVPATAVTPPPKREPPPKRDVSVTQSPTRVQQDIASGLEVLDKADVLRQQALSASKPATPKPVVVYDESGKGRKQCPACKKYVGIFVKVCVCSHVFVKKVAWYCADDSRTEVRTDTETGCCLR